MTEPTKKRTKPGPKEERLVIEDDPKEALDRLLGKPKRDVPEGEEMAPEDDEGDEPESDEPE